VGSAQLLSQFEKNAVEIVKLQLHEWKGEKFLDLRIWIAEEAGNSGGEVPTKKGFRIHQELIPDLLQAIQQARQIIKSGGKDDNG